MSHPAFFRDDSLFSKCRCLRVAFSLEPLGKTRRREQALKSAVSCLSMGTDLLKDEAEALKNCAGLVMLLLLKEGCLVERGVWD